MSPPLHPWSNCISSQPKVSFPPRIPKQKGSSNYTRVNEVCLQPPTFWFLDCLCSQKQPLSCVSSHRSVWLFYVWLHSVCLCVVEDQLMQGQIWCSTGKPAESFLFFLLVVGSEWCCTYLVECRPWSSNCVGRRLGFSGRPSCFLSCGPLSALSVSLCSLPLPAELSLCLSTQLSNKCLHVIL